MRVMTAKTQSDLPRQVLEEACDWFVDFRVGDVDAIARERFDQWLRESPQHIQAYLEITTAYARLPPVGSALPVDVDEFIACARSHASGEVVCLRAPARRPRAQPAPSRRQLLAVCLALMAVAATVFAWVASRNEGVYSTGIGEERSITLTDGSIVDLNARSRIKVRFSKAERDVDLLEGQALFIVAKDPGRAFTVRSDETLVLAVGTQFDVNRVVTGTVVTVLEGRVAVMASETGRSTGSASPRERSQAAAAALRNTGSLPEPILVSAGEQLTLAAAEVLMPQPADLAAATAWRRHRLVFDSSRLADVVAEFNRYNRRQLVIDSPALEELEISGVYASTDPASFVRFLRELPNLVVTESGGSIHIAQRREE